MQSVAVLVSTGKFMYSSPVSGSAYMHSGLYLLSPAYVGIKKS
jgi:hypothetical protein